MNAPISRRVTVPFFNPTSSKTSVLVTHIVIDLISYGDRFYWIHISEGASKPRFGPLGMSISTINAPVVSTLLVGGVTPQSSNIGGIDNAEQSFVTSLSRHISSTIQKKSGKQVGILVNCSVSEDKKILLLGTDAGGGFDVSNAFGSLVFKECINMINV